MAKPLSEQLSDLSTRAKQAEESVATARRQGAAKLQEREDHVKAEAAKRREALRKQASDAKGQVASAWSGITGKVQADVDAIRDDIDFKKYQMDEKMATKAAEEAEESAMRSIDFALYAIDNAETAVLDATLARETANSF
jgi:hypothetical protein